MPVMTSKDTARLPPHGSQLSGSTTATASGCSAKTISQVLSVHAESPGLLNGYRRGG